VKSAEAGQELSRVVEASFSVGATAPEQLPPPVSAEVAFAGRSNVGKSSLLNAMMQRRNLARTSSTPGCTRQINVFNVRTADGLEVGFVDLPGYGYAKRSKSEKAQWGPMLEGYLETRVTLKAVVLLVDVRRGPEEDDVQLVDFIRSTEGKVERRPVDIVLVATKLDKLSVAARKPALEAMKAKVGVRPIGFSAETGEGREELWKRLRHAIL
jgi:GTP-binding protein